MENTNSHLYIGSLITSFIGALILLISDFAGYYNYLSGVESWGWVCVSIETPLTTIPIIIIAFFLYYCSFISYLGIQSSKKEPSQEKVLIGLILSIVSLIIVVIGALLFVIFMLVDEPTDWWLGTGFYGGLIGSALTALIFYIIRKNQTTTVE